MKDATSDAAARARIETDLDTNFLVEAAAGTGKTTALVARIARLVATGRARITELAAITFTERASGELVLRLREKLELSRRACTDATERTRLDEALADFEAAYVGTIHGFCAELLRARPLDACVDPSFVVLGGDEQRALLDETVDRFLESALNDPPDGIRRALAQWRASESAPRAQLVRDVGMLADQRDFAMHLRRDPFDRDREIDALILAIGAFVSSGKSKVVPSLRALLVDIAAHERDRSRDYDWLETVLPGLADPTPGWDASASELRKKLGSFLERGEADLASSLARDLAPALARYEERKRALGVLDSLDLLLRTRDMLRSSRAARVALRDRFRFLFVDEVQDVDPVQKDIVLLLAGASPDEADPAHVVPRAGSLYLVGDPKQAIYGFRRADLRTYVALRRLLVPAHAEHLTLSASFRPRPAIAALVNRAFEGLFDGSDGQADHVPLVAQREAMKDFPSVIALPSPRALGMRGDVTHGAVDEALPDAIAAFVRWLLEESGLEVEDPDTRALVPVAARHVALLFKALKGAKQNGAIMARALERHGVPHGYVAAEAFFEREVVVAASALLSAIEWPDDALSVYATLRGPFLGVPDADLLAYRDAVGTLHPLARVDAAGLPEKARVVYDALSLLGTLHRERHAQAIEATLGVFLERVHADVLLLLTEEHDEARALDQVRQLARRADVRGTPFRDLARWMAERVEDPTLGAGDVASDAQRADAVSLLTIHGAKGLELPVVVIADPTTRPVFRRGADRYADPARGLLVHKLAGFSPVELRENAEAAAKLEKAEALRLLYVAATRARDVLVIATVGHGEIEGSWMAPIARALVPDDPRGPITPLARVPAFGEVSMLDENTKSPGVRPGHHAAHLGGAGVTWWDPQHLARPIPPRGEAGGLTHLVESVPDRSVIERERAFASDRDRAIDDAALGSVNVTSARRVARAPLGAALADVPVNELPIGPSGGDGARFARMVRALFAERELPLDVAARALAREYGATDDERSVAVELVARAHRDAQLAALLAGAEVRAEVAFTYATAAGPVVWGRAPLVAVRADEIAVIGITLGATIEDARVELALAAAALALSMPEASAERGVRAYLAVAR